MSITTNPFNDDKLHEECGIFGVYGHIDSAALTALGLHALQHRGQEAAGIVTYQDGQFYSHRAAGQGHVRRRIRVIELENLRGEKGRRRSGRPIEAEDDGALCSDLDRLCDLVEPRGDDDARGVGGDGQGATEAVASPQRRLCAANATALQRSPRRRAVLDA